ncbi:Acid shock protein [compost metagenome]
MFNRQSFANDHNWNRFKNCKGDFGKKFEERFGMKAPWMQGFGQRTAANIAETESGFEISLFAAGLKKESFQISVGAGDILTVAYKAPEQGSGNSFIYEEYQPASFERAFQLNGKVLTDQISASYTDGVLKITLPKNPETNKPAQEIQVL